MRRLSTDVLRELEVINLCGGERLGYICELELDVDDARVVAIVVERSGVGISLFGERERYVIPWCCIECIGEDTVLVKLDKTQKKDCSCYTQSKKRQKCK